MESKQPDLLASAEEAVVENMIDDVEAYTKTYHEAAEAARQILSTEFPGESETLDALLDEEVIDLIDDLVDKQIEDTADDQMEYELINH